MSFRLAALAALCAATTLAACGTGQPQGRPADQRDPFTETGELIAWSGGEAGALNACHTCHGLYGEGNGAGAPRLAGMPQGYLVKQLQDYADGRRRHEAMHWIASRLSQDDRLAVSAWYASRPVPPTIERPETAPELGRRLWLSGDRSRELQACALCHGLDGEGRGYGVPPIHRQPPEYLAEQLRSWKRGERQNSPQQVMLHVSRRLSEREIAAVSRYAATLPGPSAPVVSAAAPEAAP